ncbi:MULTISPECIES: hypothetical protein [Bradyrhizobium]|uniref:Uncharacterized protein n=3 Tax=Bradyrhizobium TaxID=374 RepID=A0A410VIW0_9BRAD|nr:MULTISPECIES: hypothetical protein [Bradyrhizobium]MCG2629485.1 hypothetical protein [Bradyrhizobium zhengyangense]MCG2644887.1 hypothetical protein [Bradyrhizobium zhengyangense]MCG2670999.1 hypothetical protein [Bradyrhizobium zhengyangense]MDN4984634.1 hypothetical protein [Bradyrhizobium sp. WYCCWR 13022]MDN5002626.1 hypothetical protein [Bradyrhizobium sp. WYCCWR 12677]
MSPSTINERVSITRLGGQDYNFFFGYYNKTPWDGQGRLILGHQVDEPNFRIGRNSGCNVGYFDEAREFRLVDRTQAWNWQMGSQLQWLTGMPGRNIIYNIRTSHDAGGPYPNIGARITDVDTGRTRDLNIPIYVVAANSKFAMCIDYRRLYKTHETIGYCALAGRLPLDNAPDDDGIWRLDIASGDSTLVVSYRQLYELAHKPSMDKAIHWVSHIEINPSSTRVLFLHRWTERVEDETCFLHRLITMDPDGSNLRLLECSDHPLPQLARRFDSKAVGTYDYEKSEYQISHPLWRDDSSIVVWGPHAGRINYQVYQDAHNGLVQTIGDGLLRENGHMSYSPVNMRWLLSDTYPHSETNLRDLFLFDANNEVRLDLGSFYTDPTLAKENRCDLHPRWSRDGKCVCIDSYHERRRRMYTIDVSALV